MSLIVRITTEKKIRKFDDKTWNKNFIKENDSNHLTKIIFIYLIVTFS